MKNVLDKIADIERKSESVLSEIDKAKTELPGILEREYSGIDAEYEQKHRNIIDEKTRAENDSADKKIEEIVSKHSKKMTELKTYFEENKKMWEEEIYKKIIE